MKVCLGEMAEQGEGVRVGGHRRSSQTSHGAKILSIFFLL